MTATREAVFQAIFARLQNVAGIKSTSRRFTLPGNLVERNVVLPTLMLWEQPEKKQHSGRGLPIHTWYAWIVVYFKNTNFQVAGATIINPILESIEVALKPDNPISNELTLNKLVHYCRIDGEVFKETGDTNPEGLGGIVVPLEILVP